MVLLEPGFVPRDELADQRVPNGATYCLIRLEERDLCVEQMDPKPFLPCRGPLGSLRGLPTPAAAQLASLKQCSPLTRSRLHCSATPEAAKISNIRSTMN